MDKRHHACVAEEEEPVRKKERRIDLDGEYVCIATLTGSVNHEDNTWIIDSGASKNMSGYKETFTDLVMKDSPHKVRLGDDHPFSIKGKGTTSYKLISSR